MEALPLPPVCGCGHYTVRDRVPQSSVSHRKIFEQGANSAQTTHIHASFSTMIAVSNLCHGCMFMTLIGVHGLHIDKCTLIRDKPRDY